LLSFFPFLKQFEVVVMSCRWSVRDTLLIFSAIFSAIFFAAPLAVFADDLSTQLRPGLGNNSANSTKSIRPNRVRRNRSAANAIAKYHWLDRAAQADPQLIESITDYHSAAKILVTHRRLGEIAEADHYLCRRLTRWKDVARKLAANPQADRVIGLDPEGIYRAIKNDRRLPKILARNPMYYRMIGENPDLGKILSTYM
jgi:hypothetical protein